MGSLARAWFFLVVASKRGSAVTVSSLDGATHITLDGRTGELSAVGGPASAIATVGGSLLSFGDDACVPEAASVRSIGGGGVIVTRAAKCATAGASVVITDTFAPLAAAVSWTQAFGVAPGAATFTQPLGVALNFSGEAAGAAAIWATWTRGCVSNNGAAPAMCFSRGPWRDPFSPVAMPLSAPSLTRLGSIQYNSGAFAHFGEHVDDSLTVPLVTVMRASDDSAFTLLLSPDDLTPELLLRIDGSQVILARLFQRLKAGATPPLAFTMLIRAHAADWRPALKFWVDSFPG
jgi:hypothetical protein